MASLLRVLRSHHFWLIAAMMAAITLFHYPHQLLGGNLPDPSSSLGLTRHSLERVMLLIPVTYASFIFGLRAGMVSLAVAYLIMLPRALYVSQVPRDALFESLGVVIIGSLVNLWFSIYRRIIAQRKIAEATLRESEKNFRDFFESAPDAIWVQDLEGNITAANESAARLVGYTVSELCRANARLFVPAESLEQAREIKGKLLHGQPANMPYEQKLIRKDGSQAICMLATNLIVRDGKPTALQTIAADITEEKRLYDNLRYYLKEITRAQEEERKRISRELHDSAAQNLIALIHRVENFLNETSGLPAEDARVVWGFHKQMKDLLEEVRRFSRDLRPSIIDDLGLLAGIEWLIDEIQKEYGIKGTINVTGEEKRLSPEMELMLFRIVQEALRNVGKHARASEFDVAVEFAPVQIRVTVHDNGAGFNLPEDLGDLPQSGKLGLTGMQERTQLIGGTLKIESVPGRGTTLMVEAPL